MESTAEDSSDLDIGQLSNTDYISPVPLPPTRR